MSRRRHFLRRVLDRGLAALARIILRKEPKLAAKLTALHLRSSEPKSALDG